ncbi:MAG: DUF853 family protein [Erysipelotrichaceae bacterium]|nr:DUF853 family protein [Erysipelotrichaceae bacterium]
MYKDNKIWIGRSNEEDVVIYPSMANRHGLIAGATGTGKTTTLKVMAESFSDAGVPVFLADAKGDLAGLCKTGVMNENIQTRIDSMQITDFAFDSYPVTFWDVYQEAGLPLRTTISEMGSLLLARILGLNEVQSEILTIIFKIADDESQLIIDTKDLRSLISFIGENLDTYSSRYGNIARQSLGAITRSIIALESQGGELFFGEPALDIHDWLTTDINGKGKIQILECEKLMQNPTMYATFMLWMMAELYETLPEAGDLAKPRLVFFFDEAHMLFDTASKALQAKIEQVVKLIRSKGVGIYFITQSPSDIPNEVLAQLSNKIQHSLHAYTPAEQRKARAASESFRVNPEFDTYETLLNMGIGEALVSVLDEQGIPTIVKRTKILPPQSMMGVLDPYERQAVIQNDLLSNKYADMVDRDSAYEFFERLKKAQYEEQEALKEQQRLEKEEAARQKQEEKERLKAEKVAAKAKEKAEKEAAKAKEKAEKEAAKAEQQKKKKVDQAINNVASTTAGTIGREVGNTIGSTFGGKLGKRLGGNIGASLGRGIFKTLLKR